MIHCVTAQRHFWEHLGTFPSCLIQLHMLCLLYILVIIYFFKYCICILYLYLMHKQFPLFLQKFDYITIHLVDSLPFFLNTC